MYKIIVGITYWVTLFTYNKHLRNINVYKYEYTYIHLWLDDPSIVNT